MLTKEIANIIINHKESGRMGMVKYNFNFAEFYTSSKKFGKIFDVTSISKLYKLQDSLQELPEDIANNMYLTLNINDETSVKIFNIKDTIIFLTMLRDNNHSELEANLEWLQKHC